MPKELTHWYIAGEALQRKIPREIREIIVGNPALYYIGAITHDIPFYDLTKPPKRSIESLGNRLHGVDGEDTWAPLMNLLRTALCLPQKHAALAVLLGMMTHFVTDSTFHPLVYYLSGNYFAEDPEEQAKAVFRHRLLETAMDLWLKQGKRISYPISAQQLWSEVGEAGRQTFWQLLERGLGQGETWTGLQLGKAWRNHRFLQTAFQWSIPWRLVALYRRFGHSSVEKLEALFYAQPLDVTLFNQPLDWLHPVSGVSQRTSLAELYDLCVNRVVLLFQQLGDQPLEAWPHDLQGYPPLSLDSGQPHVPVKEMKFFQAEPIEMRLRRD